MPNKGDIRKIRVLVVDDSAVVRQALHAILSSDANIMASVAPDPVIAFSKIEKELPHVVITDLEMPRMDGLAFLTKVMESDKPLPVIVCSGLAESGSERALSALALGAVDVIAKPKLGVRDFLHESAVMLLDSVWAAANAKVRGRKTIPVTTANSADVILPPLRQGKAKTKTEPILAIAASTGGTEALEQLLVSMPPTCPPIVIVQHMPEIFTQTFAARLDRVCSIDVKEASHGDLLLRGRALIAPGNRHLLIRSSGLGYFVEVHDGPLVSRHRPSADVLFRSVARAAGENALGVIMTGMGADGAEGLLEMRKTGAATIAQDESTCVVFGMPREAIQLGAAQHVLPLDQIARAALTICEARSQ